MCLAEIPRTPDAKSQVMVIWMVVLLIAQVQYEYDLVRVVCTRAFVCMLHTEVLWMTATTCFLVCLYSFQLLCLKCEPRSISMAT